MATTSQAPAGGTGRGLTLQQALEEAQRCLLCHDAPCSAACPGGTDPAKFVRQIRFYNLKGAARTVLRNNPLGGVCAYVCPSDETCRGACLREGLDRPIDIDGIQAFAVEYGRANGVVALERGEPRDQRVAVVGAGPAGLAAAARLAGYGYQVTLFEAKDQTGGMLRYGVPPNRLTDAELDADIDEILGLGIEVKTGTTFAGDARDLLKEGFEAAFVAPGLWKSYRLDLPGGDLDGVSTALEFLADVHVNEARARSLVEGVNVAIIGGGSVAMDVATCARQLGAGRIYAIALEGMTELPAMGDELSAAMADGLIIKPQCQVTEILGTAGKVSGLTGVETEWIEPGKLVPANARPIEGTSWTLSVGAVFQAIGQGAAADADGLVVAATRRGPLVAADAVTQATSADGVFAGGDIVRGAATVVAAVGDGKRAAAAIHEILSKEVA